MNINKIFLFILILTIFNPAFANLKLDNAVKEITEKLILIRVGLDKRCPVSMEESNIAGAQFELATNNAIAGLDKNDINEKFMSSLANNDCVKSCTCFALNKIYGSFSLKLNKIVSNASIEGALSKMTDNDYEKCMRSYKNFCEIQNVKELLKTIRKAK